MPARYLVRFDDVCPTMNWQMWSGVQQALVRCGVAPIVAVVPENRDPRLDHSQARADFWSEVRQWQRLGWTIGWHGHRHEYRTEQGGLIGIHAGSEFAGVPIEAQRASLAAARHIFQNEGVTPEIWVAPGHSFDLATVSLLPEFGIHTISDGFYWRPVHEHGCTWLPQQLWRFRRMPFGLWTVCLHINHWRDRDLEEFEGALAAYADSIISVRSLLADSPHTAPGVLDRMFSRAYRRAVLLKRRSG